PSLPQFKQSGAAADTGVGVANGILGGATGFVGIVVTVWSGLRGWPKDEQRAVFQPTGVATFVMTALWLGGAGMVATDHELLFAIGLPVVLAGTWAGFGLYGKLDESGFRKAVLVLLLVSGASLLM